MVREDRKGHTLVRLGGLFPIWQVTLLILLVGWGLCVPQNLAADGSKDLVANGGHRPFLAGGEPGGSFERTTTFYVFARAGEVLEFGSSAFGIGDGDILFTRPNGSSSSCQAMVPAGSNLAWGRIENIDQESNGPNPDAGGYQPCALLVESGEEGLWAVTFTGPAPTTWQYTEPVVASADWVQPHDVYTISAWDISIRDRQGNPTAGRVFTPYLPLIMGDQEASLNADVHVLTADGYQYRLHLNGQRAHHLTLFANNTGFEAAGNGDPLYRSVKLLFNGQGLPEGIQLHQPHLRDTGSNLTHKLFLQPPAADLPVSALSGQGLISLLRSPEVLPSPTSIAYAGQVGEPGVFTFNAPKATRYAIILDIDRNGVFGDRSDVLLAGQAVAGHNTVPWDGRDGNGQILEGQALGYQAQLMFIAGEVHVPFMDVEENANGVKIERRNGRNAPDYTVYYDDRELNGKVGAPAPMRNLFGLDSHGGAHQFRVGFGDEAGIDTWTWVASESVLINEPFMVANTDLRIAITPEQVAPQRGETTTIDVALFNDGPDNLGQAEVAIHIPPGLSVQASNQEEGHFDATTGIWNVTYLSPGEQATLSLEVDPSDAGEHIIWAQVWAGGGLDPDSRPGNFQPQLPGFNDEDDNAAARLYVDPLPQVGGAQRILEFDGDGRGFEVTYAVVVENLGNTPLEIVQVVEDLRQAFDGAEVDVLRVDASEPLVANPGYNGFDDNQLLDPLASQLDAGETGLVTFTLNVTPISNFGPYTLAGQVHAVGLNNETLSDDAAVGTDPDPNGNGDPGDLGEDTPLVLSIPTAPSLGVSLELLHAVEDDSTLEAQFSIVIENLGDVPLRKLQVYQELDSFFGTDSVEVSSFDISAPFELNGSFNGWQDSRLLLGDDTLPVGGKFSTTFTARGPVFGMFEQRITQARAVAETPKGELVTDHSDDGPVPDVNGNGHAGDEGEDDPTVWSVSTQPVIGVALWATQVQGDLRTFTATYEINVENLGETTLTGVQVIEDLESMLPGSSYAVKSLASTPNLQVNPGFNGSSDKRLLSEGINTLGLEESGIITLVVEVIPETFFGPYRNAVFASAEGPAGYLTTDASNNDSVSDPNGNGDPGERGEDQPWEIHFAAFPEVGVALSSANVTGDLAGFTVRYVAILENLGDVPVHNVQLEQSFAASYAGSAFKVANIAAEAPLKVNPLFDGQVHTALLDPTSDPLRVGETRVVSFDLVIEPFSNFGPYEATMIASASGPFDTVARDSSDAGQIPDANGNRNANEPGENDPTLVVLGEKPAVGLAVAIDSVVGDLKNFSAAYRVTVENLGDVPLDSIIVHQSFDEVFGEGQFAISDLKGGRILRINPTFDGSDQPSLLLVGDEALPAGQQDAITFTLDVTPGEAYGPFASGAIVEARSYNGMVVTDRSAPGLDPDPNGNQQPGDQGEDDPTPIEVTENPVLGLALAVNSVDEFEDGFRFAVTGTLRNLGDVPLNAVQVHHQFDDAFPDADVRIESIQVPEDSPLAPDLTGAGLLDVEQSVLDRGETALFDLVVDVTTSSPADQYTLSMKAEAQGPSGAAFDDASHTGAEPDPDGDSDPDEPEENQPTPLLLPRAPALNLDFRVDHVEGDTTQLAATLRLMLRNEGNAALDAVSLALPLNTLFGEGIDVDVQSVRLSNGAPVVLMAGYDGAGITELLEVGNSRLPVGGAAEVEVQLSMTSATRLQPTQLQAEAAAQEPGGDIITVLAMGPSLLARTSSGRDGGLESSGDLASLVAQRTYRNAMSGPASETHILQTDLRQAAAGWGGLVTGDLPDLFPTEGPNNTEPIGVTPDDLLGITNATSVLAADYQDDGKRVGSIFATTSPAGIPYNHTKVICDRLRGGVLENVWVVSVSGYPFIMMALRHSSGEVDYAVNFIAGQQGNAYAIDSQYLRETYSPALFGASEMLNLQIWSYDPAFTLALAEEVVDRMEGMGDVHFAGNLEAVPALPDVYVRSSRYQNGTVFLEIQNDTEEEQRLTVDGTGSIVEQGPSIPISAHLTVPAGHESTLMEISTGSLYDALLTITQDGSSARDELYVADGPWGLVTDTTGQTNISSFQVLPNPKELSADGYILERGAALEGELGDWAVLFRYLRPGGQPVSVSDYNALRFMAAGQGNATARIETQYDGQRRVFSAPLRLSKDGEWYEIPFDEFSPLQVGSWDPSMVSAVSFALDGGSDASEEVALRVEEVAFVMSIATAVDPFADIPAEFMVDQSYPNPFRDQTTIRFGLPVEADVVIEVYDMLGRRVARLVDDRLPAGYHLIPFNGAGLASGNYVYRMLANDQVFVRTMSRVR